MYLRKHKGCEGEGGGYEYNVRIQIRIQFRNRVRRLIEVGISLDWEVPKSDLAMNGLQLDSEVGPFLAGSLNMKIT